jgi:integrase
MMNLAEVWGYRPDGSNPTRHIEPFPEKRRERYLSEREQDRLGRALQEAERAGRERPEVIAAIRLLIFTGCRLNEILRLRWEFVDWEQAYLRLPDSKTGSKVLHLNAPAMQVLGGLRGGGSPWVIPGVRPGQPLVNLTRPWRRILSRAGIQSLRIHDLRHSFGAIAAGSGLALPIIGRLLGHTQVATTARYAHLADDPIRQASEAVGQRIAARLDRRTAAEVLPIREARR